MLTLSQSKILGSNKIYQNNPKFCTCISILKRQMSMKQGHYGILKICKRPKMNCWESLFIQTYQQQGLLIKQQVNNFNPIYAQGSSKMMSHNHTFNLCSVPCKPSSKKLHSQGEPVTLPHIFTITV